MPRTAAFIDPELIPSTGSWTIDMAHKRLAHMVNAAYENWQRGVDPNTLRAMLDEFLGAAERHFREEEQEAQRAGCAPERLKAHHELHAHFKQRFQKIADHMLADGAVTEAAIDSFALMDRLLFEHEFLDDQDFYDLFSGRPHPAREEELVSWEDSLNLGQTDIDRQHKTLALMVNRLHQALTGDAERGRVVALFNDLRDHTAWHFGQEESWMHEAGVPDSHRRIHATAHRVLLRELESMAEAFRVGDYADLDKVLGGRLRFWLVDHILYFDKKAAELADTLDP